MCFGSTDTGAGDARRRERERQERIRQGKAKIDKSFEQFTPEFFDSRRDALMDYERPQIEDQYSDAMRQLAFALARSGLSRSSVGATRRAQGAEKFEKAKQDSAMRGEKARSDAQSAVEEARQRLVANNAALADPTEAANSAIASAQQMTTLPAYDPVLNLFGDISEGLATQADLERRQKARYPGLFTSGNRSTNVSG